MATLEEGTLTADGTVQDVITGTHKLISKKRAEGYIDLSNMVEGDVVVITQYIKVKSGGSYRQKWQAEYSGEQEPGPLVGFAPHFCPYGIQITLEQTATGAGGYKDFDYFFEKY